MGGMGVRDFESFNLALLTKQWRLFITSPSSLMAKWLQAKYFPLGDFLGTSLSRRPSYLWRSLLEGRNLLSLGIRTRIWNGLSTKIQHNKWIPSLRGRVPSSFLCRGNERHATELIDFNQGFWRQDRIRYLFLHHDHRQFCKFQ